MQAKLVIVAGASKPREISLSLPMIIGRGREASLTLPHPLVSRNHCEIVERDGKLYVRDLDSLNGTFVGNQRVAESVLSPGELLTIGTVTFRAVYGDWTEPLSVDELPGDTPTVAPAGKTVQEAAPVEDEPVEMDEFIEVDQIEEIDDELVEDISGVEVIDGPLADSTVPAPDPPAAAKEAAPVDDIEVFDVAAAEAIEDSAVEIVPPDPEPAGGRAAQPTEAAAEEPGKDDDLNQFFKSLD